MPAAVRELLQDPTFELRYVVLDMPCSFFSLRSLRWGAGEAGSRAGGLEGRQPACHWGSACRKCMTGTGAYGV